VSDYLLQRYKGAAWDKMNDLDNDTDAEKIADIMGVRGAA
jgi:hypothetical protein